MSEFVAWREWVYWKTVRDALGDWTFHIEFRAVVHVDIPVNLNWIRDLVAHVLTWIINFTLNLIILALKFLRILVDIVAAVIAILLAPVVLPIWYLWGKLKDAELFRLSTQGLGELNLLNLFWNAGASDWEKQVHQALWKQVENIYSIVPAAQKRLPSIKRMLRRTLFMLALQHLGVAGVIETLRTYLSNIIKWIDNQWKAAFQDQQSWFQRLLSDLNSNLSTFIEGEIHKVRVYIDSTLQNAIEPLKRFQNDLNNIQQRGLNWREFLPRGMVTSDLGRLILDLYNGSVVTKQVVQSIWDTITPPEKVLTDEEKVRLAKLEKLAMIDDEINRLQDPTSHQSRLIQAEGEYWEEKV